MTLAGHAPDPAGALAVLVAFGIDGAFGEPPPRMHPVVWIGRVLAALGAPWPQLPPAAAFAGGTLAWLAGAGLCAAIAAVATRAIALIDAATVGWLVRGALLGVLLKPLLAWRMLRDEVGAVECALAQSLDAGRQQLRRIVSRDTSALSATVVRESALESLAENLNDSVIATLFWFTLAGLPGAALYRFANTADAMWGYRGPFEWAGKWAARADDVLSYLPARLSAYLLALAAWRWPRGLAREARATPSPNGGWPMAALAMVLDVRLCKPGHYLLHADGRFAGPQDLSRALAVSARAAWGAAALAALVLSL